MSNSSPTEKRTQAERRAETRGQLISSASRLFGEQGYVATALEDIAEDCALTIRPVYYHFGSKRGLFLAVNSQMEARAMEALDCDSSAAAWQAFLKLCKDPVFRQIIFIDAPNILGRERWPEAEKLRWSVSLTSDTLGDESHHDSSAIMRGRAALAALMEAARFVIDSGDDLGVRSEAKHLISILLPQENTGGNFQPANEALTSTG